VFLDLLELTTVAEQSHTTADTFFFSSLEDLGCLMTKGKIHARAEQGC